MLEDVRAGGGDRVIGGLGKGGSLRRRPEGETG
jgi:hypothetical protein